MNQRIKHVWTISIVAMATIFAMQAYWLYKQYEYSSMIKAEKMKETCTKAFEDENRLRSGNLKKKEEERTQFVINLVREDKDANTSNTQKKYESLTIHQLINKKRQIKLKNVNMSDAVEMTSRYMTSLHERFSRKKFDSLIYAAEGVKSSSFRFVKTKRYMGKPVFSVSGGISKTLHVRYSTNPLEMEAVEMTIHIPASQILMLMNRQLAASVLLLIILGFCMMYQIKTIMIQRRINAIRHEFMKNMIYEMKQPPATAADDAKAIKIGSTLFFYELNELRHGNETTIITSRQAELLRILAENINKVVPREVLLKEVWGDDSYSNSMALNVQITYLRRALKSDAALSIEAIIRKGYVLKTMQSQ